ncbi:hypothetical protein KC865_03680 [Candidatus Kaiserbacteria bacterium]|nr:hypothetical protein [Candidatus Kaiserbacteria bacterium]USN91957.1 MAG: hypothetical protein H6782_03720 [Candidatus Nomurabacteria bacterium]
MTTVKKVGSTIGSTIGFFFKHPLEYFQIIFPGVLIAATIIALTYNPTNYNYYTYAKGLENIWQPIPMIMGGILLVGWLIGLRAIIMATGILGKISLFLLVAPTIWSLFYYNIIDINNPNQIVWLGIAVLSLVMGYSLRHRLVRRKALGLYSTEEEPDDSDD